MVSVFWNYEGGKKNIKKFRHTDTAELLTELQGKSTKKIRMAYNRTNLLTKIIEIQELTLYQYHKVGLTYKEIYWQHIYPKYHISYRTFHTYLGTPAKKQLKELQENKGKQLKLFE